MENLYLIVVIILIALAVSDLIVGVSNDAVNFLNSAIGSKAAPVIVIMIVASLGILVGATFSSGLMEVARKGIFHPAQFNFAEIMIIFLAVMITDILLLDFFNTHGLPTSTTVSIVFELLGAAVAISLIKMQAAGESLIELGKYINSEKALAIISGILLSVVIAFAVGAFVQYLARTIFTFQYKKKLKYFGALWGGFSITAITYFILIKGAKGSSFISDENLTWIKDNTVLIIFFSLIGWIILLQLLSWVVKLNIPKFIVLVGTFALAMAFAGNDLVNFIGVPLAGLESYKEYLEIGNDQFHMEALAAKIKTPTVLLLIAGLIMTVTLWLSKKSRSVSRTEINLARQIEGEERFGSTLLSRAIVKIAVSFNNGVKRIIPNRTLEAFNKRFSHPENTTTKSDTAAFDVIRATSNLTVASILIAFATSLKLPLSTTYVTFMVAMGTSLSDRAWGRESAVYRITGVFTVIGGWFLTAITAFTVSAIFAIIIYYTSFIGVVILVIFALIVIVRTYILFKRKERKFNEHKAKMAEEEDAVLNGVNIVQKCTIAVTDTLSAVPALLSSVIQGLGSEDLKKLRKTNKKIDEVNKSVKFLKDNLHRTIEKLEEDSVETGHYYVQVLDYLREIAHCLNFIVTPSYEHVDNNHKGLIDDQKYDLNSISIEIARFYTAILEIIKLQDYPKSEAIINDQQQILDTIEKLKKKQIKRIKGNEVGTRNSLLYLGMLEEIKNLLLYTINLFKSQRDFITHLNNIRNGENDR